MADIGIKINSDFKQAEKDFQSLSQVSESTRVKIEKFQKSFTTEQIDKFIDKNKLNAIAIQATQGPLAASRAEMMGLQREIQRLIRSGLSPESDAIKKLSGDYDRLQKEIGTTTQKTSIFGGVITGILGADIVRMGLSYLVRGFKAVVEAASNTENSITQFTTMLGGSETAARAMVTQLQILGAQTPFEFKDLAEATKMLLGFGAATQNNIVPTLRMLGDLAQGDAERLQGISRIYGKVMASGRMQGDQFNQFIDNQVPIAQGLAKVWGVDVAQAMQRIRSGAGVTAMDVQRAMQQMTGAGGMFEGGMIRASQTFSGVMSTLQDSLTMSAAAIGEKLLPMLKNAAIFVTGMINKFLDWALQGNNLADTLQYVGIAVGSIIAAIVIYKGAIIAAAVAQRTWLIVQAASVVAQVAWAAVTGAATATTLTFTGAVKALGVAMMLNPVGLIITAIAALIIGLILCVKHWDTVKYYAADFAQTAAIWMIKLGLVIYGSVIRMVGQLAGQLARLPGPIGRMFSGIQSGAQIAVGAMERTRDSIIASQNASRAAHAATLRRNSAEQAAANRTAAVQEGALTRVNSAESRRAQTFTQLLEAMELSQNGHNTRMINQAAKFFTDRAEQEVADGASRLEFLRAQYAALDQLHFRSNAEREAAATGLANAIVAEEKRIMASKVAFGQQMISTTGEMLRDLQTVMKNAGKESRALAYGMKGVAMAEAAINSYLAFTKALAAFPPPFNYIAAGITLAAGLAKQAAIASTPIPSAQTGIQDYRVPDVRSTRNDRAAVMASAGEQVTVTPRGEDSGGRTEINIKIEEDAIFRVVTKGIKTGRIDISNRNLGSGVFPS